MMISSNDLLGTAAIAAREAGFAIDHQRSAADAGGLDEAISELRQALSECLVAQYVLGNTVTGRVDSSISDGLITVANNLLDEAITNLRRPGGAS